MKPGVYTVYLIKISVCDLCVGSHTEPNTECTGKREWNVCRSSKEVFTSLHYAVNPLSALINFQLSWSSVTKLVFESQTKERIIIWADLKFGQHQQTYSEKCAPFCDHSAFSSCTASYSNFFIPAVFGFNLPKTFHYSESQLIITQRRYTKNENVNTALLDQASS